MREAIQNRAAAVDNWVATGQEYGFGSLETFAAYDQFRDADLHLKALWAGNVQYTQEGLF